jgi:hypothetical protein
LTLAGFAREKIAGTEKMHGVCAGNGDEVVFV